MQGKERNSDKFDEQFIDQAWAKMSGKLDQEMPVIVAPSGDSKIRYGVLLLFLFIGFASGIGTMFFLQKEKPVEIEKPMDSKHNPMEVAAVYSNESGSPGTKPIAETDQLAVVNKASKQIEKKIKNNFSNQSVSQAEQKKQSLFDKNHYTNSSSVIVFNQNADPKTDQQEMFGDASDNQNDLSGIKTGNNSATNEVANNTAHKKELVIRDNLTFQDEALHLLSSSNIPLLIIPGYEVSLDLQMLAEPPKFSFGFYLGTQTRDFNGLHGLTSGVYANYQMDSKFSIRSGLGYSILKGFHLQSQGIADPLTPAFFEPIEPLDLQVYSTVYSSDSNQDLPIQSLHYIDLPVALDYRMNDKLGILMGMKFSYLLDTKTNGYFSDNLNSDDAAKLDKAIYDSMKKLDIATVLGFGIYPTPKVGLELKYNHGLVDYTIDEKWHIRQLNANKTFELSLNYFLR